MMKQELTKLLDVGIIYAIKNTTWVSNFGTSMEEE